jgi:perosamine synthetase
MSKYQIGFPILGNEEKKNLSDCIETGWISSRGKYVEKFEKSFARFCGVKYGVSVSNGTTALMLAFMALDIRPGEEIIVPDLTFGATANAAIMLGIKPVLVDADKKTWNLDPEDLERNISEKTKAIVVVHLYGLPCEMDKILKIAKKYKLKIIEDAAEAHGAEYLGKKVGSFGDIACFSFYGNKIITTGEGGMCLTNSKRLYDRMEIIKNHGMKPSRKYWHEIVGSNFRMTNIQAAIGLAQMKKINSFIRKKIQIAQWYKAEIKKQKLAVEFQSESKKGKSVWWMFTVLVNHKKNIYKIMNGLLEDKIDSRPILIPLSIMPAFQNLRKSKNIKHSLDIGKRGITLPSNLLLARKDIEFIIRKLKELI